MSLHFSVSISHSRFRYPPSTSCRVKFMRVLLVRQTFQRFMISCTTVTLANQTKRNAPCSSYLLFSYAISTGFNPYVLAFFATRHAIIAFTFFVLTTPEPSLRYKGNVHERFTTDAKRLIRKNSDSQNTRHQKLYSCHSSTKNETENNNSWPEVLSLGPSRPQKEKRI